MNAISKQVRELYEKADDRERQQIQEDLRDLGRSLSNDFDLVLTFPMAYLSVALIHIGFDIDLFRTLTSNDIPLTLEDLVQKTGGAPGMLGHIFRAMASVGIIKETSKNTFAPNQFTHVFADENVNMAMAHILDLHEKVAMTLPAYLKQRNYQDMSNPRDLPFNQALNTDLAPFDWLRQHPEQMKAMGHGMAVQRPGHWIDSYAVEEEVGKFTPTNDSALLVDVGGGYGQQAISFHSKFPALPGRVIVQDIPETLDRAPKAEGIEFVVHDFFTEQPIKNAKFYYLRHILHDWNDDDSVRILKNVILAMGPNSKIVVDEVVLPDAKVPWQCAYMDLMMMSVLGGKERTRGEWEALMERAGLRIVEVHKYDSKMQSVIVAVPK